LPQLTIINVRNRWWRINRSYCDFIFILWPQWWIDRNAPSCFSRIKFYAGRRC